MMPPRLVLMRLKRVISSPTASAQCLCFRAGSRGLSSTNGQHPLEEETTRPGSNQEQLPHVSEEAASTAKIMGKAGPELEQGTPVQEVLKRDQNAKEKAPQILKESSMATIPKGSRSFSSFAARKLHMEAIVSSDGPGSQPTEGHKFGLPALPLGPHDHLKYRYDPVVKQVTQLLMRDGELARAQTNMARILNHLRTAPPPSINPSRPLMPGAPPASHLPLNPILYLTVALDSVAPLLRLRSQSGMAGGGANVQLPVPLRLRQRRRQAVMWILEAASKKPSKGSGKGMFAQKVAEELVAIVEGRSSVWERRGNVHKIAITARSNLNKPLRSKRRLR